MFDKLLGKADTGKLIVTAIAVSIDPTGIAAAGFGADAVLHFRDKFFSQHPSLVALSKEIEAEFNSQLNSSAYNKPEGARQVLPQMLAVALQRQTNLCAKGLIQMKFFLG